MTEDKRDRTADNADQGASQGANQGEGNPTAAREYNEAQRRFVQSGRVEDKAREAAKSLDRNKAELERAEAVGRSHEAAEDPAVTRKP